MPSLHDPGLEGLASNKRNRLVKRVTNRKISDIAPKKAAEEESKDNDYEPKPDN